MGPQLFETPMGRRFYESTMPAIARSLELIATHLSSDQHVVIAATRDAVMAAFNEAWSARRVAYDLGATRDYSRDQWVVAQTALHNAFTALLAKERT